MNKYTIKMVMENGKEWSTRISGEPITILVAVRDLQRDMLHSNETINFTSLEIKQEP